MIKKPLDLRQVIRWELSRGIEQDIYEKLAINLSNNTILWNNIYEGIACGLALQEDKMYCGLENQIKKDLINLYNIAISDIM